MWKSRLLVGGLRVLGCRYCGGWKGRRGRREGSGLLFRLGWRQLRGRSRRTLDESESVRAMDPLGRGEEGENAGIARTTDLLGSKMVERADEDRQSRVDADNPGERENVVDH